MGDGLVSVSRVGKPNRYGEAMEQSVVAVYDGVGSGKTASAEQANLAAEELRRSIERNVREVDPDDPAKRMAYVAPQNVVERVR